MPEGEDKRFRILSLDGGGAKGFYTLGVLRHIEAMVKKPLYEAFDLIYGTSTGSIIGTMSAIGMNVDTIHDLYKKHVPTIMKPWLPCNKTARLEEAARDIFAEKGFNLVKTGLGIVTANWGNEKPMIFKSDAGMAHGRKESFVPGFGCLLRDAVQASCSAYPFFRLKTVTTSTGNVVQLGDGGYCANNPALYAVADAVRAFQVKPHDIRLVSVGVGMYPPPKKSPLGLLYWIQKLPSVKLLQKSLEINTQSMAQLHEILFGDIHSARISDAFTQPELATDLVEHDLTKLNKLKQRGEESFATYEGKLRKLLL
jgi:predicted acylesterase/phospholipase RssA